MQMVIDIPDDIHEALRKCAIISGQRSGKTLMSVIFNAVANGILLPEHHGKLIDADELSKRLQELADDEWNQQVMASKGLECAVEIIDDTSAIIEASEEGAVG